MRWSRPSDLDTINEEWQRLRTQLDCVRERQMTLVSLVPIAEGLVANLESAAEDWCLISITLALGSRSRQKLPLRSPWRFSGWKSRRLCL